MDEELRSELTQLQRSWLGHLQSWERSGSTLKSYAERHALDHRRLYRFKRILTDKGIYREGEAVSRRFVRAQVEPMGESSTMCRVRFRNGCVMELVGETNPVVLREVLHTLSMLP